MLLVESDERFGKPDFAKERGATVQTGRDGKQLLTSAQVNWIFDEVVGIPVRREVHELSAMLEEIETHGRNVLTGTAAKAKYPPPELCGTLDVEAKDSTQRVESVENTNHVDGEENTKRMPAGTGAEEASTAKRSVSLPVHLAQGLQEHKNIATATDAKESRRKQLIAELNSIRAGDISADARTDESLDAEIPAP